MKYARRNRDKNIMKHERLKPEELPTLGTLVAIDAEFVSMQQVRHPSSGLDSLFTRRWLLYRKRQNTAQTERKK